MTICFVNFVNVYILLRHGVEHIIFPFNVEKCPRLGTIDSRSGTRELVALKLKHA